MRSWLIIPISVNDLLLLIAARKALASWPGIVSNAALGQVTSAYQDQSTTYDPGGRLIQFVARINF